MLIPSDSSNWMEMNEWMEETTRITRFYRMISYTLRPRITSTLLNTLHRIKSPSSVWIPYRFPLCTLTNEPYSHCNYEMVKNNIIWNRSCVCLLYCSFCWWLTRLAGYGCASLAGCLCWCYAEIKRTHNTYIHIWNGWMQEWMYEWKFGVYTILFTAYFAVL